MKRQLFFKFANGISLIVLSFAAVSCSGYTLRGKVVRGDISTVELVHEMDQRLKQPGIGHAEVMVRRDPETLNQHLAGRDRTGPEGRFTVSIDGFGAGWMEEKWMVQCILRGYQNAEEFMELPPKNSPWRLLITLAPGPSMSPTQKWDYREDIERYR